MCCLLEDFGTLLIVFAKQKRGWNRLHRAVFARPNCSETVYSNGENTNSKLPQPTIFHQFRIILTSFFSTVLLDESTHRPIKVSYKECHRTLFGFGTVLYMPQPFCTDILQAPQGEQNRNADKCSSKRYTISQPYISIIVKPVVSSIFLNQ